MEKMAWQAIAGRLYSVWKIREDAGKVSIDFAEDCSLLCLKSANVGSKVMLEEPYEGNLHVRNLLERRKEIGAELEAYCEWRNCGIIDHICDAEYELQSKFGGQYFSRL